MIEWNDMSEQIMIHIEKLEGIYLTTLPQSVGFGSYFWEKMDIIKLRTVRFLVCKHKICKVKGLRSESGYESCSYFFDRDGIERDDIFRKNYYVKQLLVKELLVKQLLHE